MISKFVISSMCAIAANILQVPSISESELDSIYDGTNSVPDDKLQKIRAEIDYILYG